MAEVAGVIAAVAAVGALFFAWRTVVEARAAHAEDERDRRLARLERLGVALTELTSELDNGAWARARVTQARARVLWVTAGTDVGDQVRLAVVTEITADAADQVARNAEAGVETLLTGLEDYLLDDDASQSTRS